jgi:uncharacterized coiled-coil protein SlyX
MKKEIDKFEILEDKIIQLIESYALLKNEKMVLEGKLAQKEIEIQEINEKVNHLSQDREKVREKIEGLLTRIDRLIASQG